MKPSHIAVRSKIFTDHHFYQSRHSTKPVSTQQYEHNQHHKVTNEYQSKKKPQFVGHQYSSSWNPLNKKYERVDKPYRELYQRKQRVQKYSNLKSDPFAVHPLIKQPQHTLNRSKQQYQPSVTYKVEQERKYMLPKDREISKPNKQYHSQTGISQQKLPVSNRKQKGQNFRNNSSLVKLAIEYQLSGRQQVMNRSLSYY